MFAARRTSRRLASAIAFACAALMACAAVVAVDRLQSDATDRRDAELELASLRLEVAQIQDVPWGASPDEGDDPTAVREELDGAEDSIRGTLDTLGRGGELPEEPAIIAPFDRTMMALREILDLVSHGRSEETGEASHIAAHEAAAVDAALREASQRYRDDSVSVLAQSRNGSAAVILLLFAAFVLFYARSVRARRTAEALAADNHRLLGASRLDALTDSLTNLRNRRALIIDLDDACADSARDVVLVLLDLNGFKSYNDGFGHPAGDTLLRHFGARLSESLEGIGTGYRIGGDEFCVLAPMAAGDGDAQAIAALAAAALSDEGPAHSVNASYGIAAIPAEAGTADDALRLADKRMYADKETARSDRSRGRSSAITRL